MKKILAIIPARGGSKGVPRKNIKNLAGKPLLAWTIEEAKKSKFIDRIIVSTEDEEIAQIAKKYGAEVPFMRPQELAKDLSLDIDFLIHALDWLDQNESYTPDIVLRLPPTSPLRRVEHIDEGIMKLLDTPEAHSVRSITKANRHPFKHWKISPDGKFIEPFLPKEVTGFDQPHVMPRQLLPDAYIQTGAVDVVWEDVLRKYNSPVGEKTTYFMMDQDDSVNIDYPEDFELAEIILNRRSGGDFKF